MTQFLSTAVFCTIAAGLAIHARLDLPWFLEWIGTLPGDLLIKKGGLTMYVPITSSLLISAVLSFVFSLFIRR